MAYEDDKREFDRIKQRSAVLVDRALFSFACSLVLFLASLLAHRLDYGGIAVLLFFAMLVTVPLTLYFGFQQKRLRLRYYNLHYRVQVEEESRISGLADRGDQ
jgi:hypothetical protein